LWHRGWSWVLNMTIVHSGTQGPRSVFGLSGPNTPRGWGNRICHGTHAQPGVLWGGGWWVAAVGLVAAHGRPTAPFLSYPTSVNTVVRFRTSWCFTPTSNPPGPQWKLGGRSLPARRLGENSVDAPPARLHVAVTGYGPPPVTAHVHVMTRAVLAHLSKDVRRC